MDKFVTIENMEALLPLIKQRFQNIENRLPIFIYKYFEPGVTDTNTGSIIRLNDKYMNQVISIEDDVVITSLTVNMNNEDITKQAYTGPFSAEIFGKVEGEEALYLRQGDSYSSGEITPDAGWGIKSISVQMGDDDITSEALSGHEVSVDDVMGDIAVEVETACEVVDEPFLSRITANGLTLANTRALLKGIKGNTLVWNHIIDDSAVTYNSTYVTKNTDGSFTIDLDGVPVNNYVYIPFSLVKDHKYLCCPSRKGSSADDNKVFFYFVRDQDPGFLYYNTKFIHTASVSVDTTFTFRVGGSTTGTITFFFQCFDLTQMFGAGNEPTLAEFEALYPLDNYATDAGRLLDFKGETLRSCRYFAKWSRLFYPSNWVAYGSTTIAVDGEKITLDVKVENQGIQISGVRFEEGHKLYMGFGMVSNVSGIALVYRGTRIWSHGYISITSPNTTYKNIITVSTDESGDKSFLFRLPIGNYTINNFQLYDLTAMFGEGNEPSTAAEFEAIMEKLGNPTTEEEFNTANLLQDITINPTAMYGYLNGEGEAVKPFENGMRSAGSVFDEVYKEDGKWYAKVNVGSVDLGEATWAYSSTVGGFHVNGWLVDSKRHAMSVIANQTNTKGYEGAYAYINTMKDKSISINSIYNGGGSVGIKDSSYSTVEAFQDAMDGVMLNYELATPRTYLLTDEWQQILNTAYQVETGGMEIILPENGSEPATSPAKIAIQYGTDGSENN